MLSEVKVLPQTADVPIQSRWARLLDQLTFSRRWMATAGDLPEINRRWFSADYWYSNDAIEGTSTGRHTTWFIQYKATSLCAHWVLRHYWRGGLIAKLLKDHYWFGGLEKTRPMMELRLLDLLSKENFPVPKPVAALVEKRGFSYQGDLLIERIEDASDLVAILSKQALSDNQWQSLGACIAAFHQRGVFHADLNAKNILQSPTGFHLIDFDRGAIRSINPRWQLANLNRLKRSFDKEKFKFPTLCYDDANWQHLLEGYRAVNPLIS